MKCAAAVVNAVACLIETNLSRCNPGGGGLFQRTVHELREGLPQTHIVLTSLLRVGSFAGSKKINKNELRTLSHYFSLCIMQQEYFRNTFFQIHIS